MKRQHTSSPLSSTPLSNRSASSINSGSSSSSFYTSSATRFLQQQQQSTNVPEQVNGQLKLIMLSAGEASKSTLFKQVSQIFHQTFDEKGNRALYRDIIMGNIVHGIKTLLLARARLRPHEPISEKNKELEQKILNLDNEDMLNIHKMFFSQKIAGAVKTLWREEVVLRKLVLETQEFQFNTSVLYYLDRDDVFDPNFVPSFRDVLLSRVKTTGIVEQSVYYNDIEVRLIDVGGQRNERIHCFDKLDGVIMPIPLSEFNLVCYEDDVTNRLLEQITVFSDIVNSRHIPLNVPIYLIFTKADLFLQKLNIWNIDHYLEKVKRIEAQMLEKLQQPQLQQSKDLQPPLPSIYFSPIDELDEEKLNQQVQSMIPNLNSNQLWFKKETGSIHEFSSPIVRSYSVSQLNQKHPYGNSNGSFTGMSDMAVGDSRKKKNKLFSLISWVKNKAKKKMQNKRKNLCEGNSSSTLLKKGSFLGSFFGKQVTEVDKSDSFICSSPAKSKHCENNSVNNEEKKKSSLELTAGDASPTTSLTPNSSNNSFSSLFGEYVDTSAEEPFTQFSQLFEDVWGHIFLFLEMKEVCAMQSVCSFFYHIGCKDFIWRSFYMNVYNIKQIDQETTSLIQSDYETNYISKYKINVEEDFIFNRKWKFAVRTGAAFPAKKQLDAIISKYLERIIHEDRRKQVENQIYICNALDTQSVKKIFSQIFEHQLSIHEFILYK